MFTKLIIFFNISKDKFYIHSPYLYGFTQSLIILWASIGILWLFILFLGYLAKQFEFVIYAQYLFQFIVLNCWLAILFVILDVFVFVGVQKLIFKLVSLIPLIYIFILIKNHYLFILMLLSILPLGIKMNAYHVKTIINPFDKVASIEIYYIPSISINTHDAWIIALQKPFQFPKMLAYIDDCSEKPALYWTNKNTFHFIRYTIHTDSTRILEKSTQDCFQD